MFGKRGQEGITLGTLLLIILGVVVVVVIIMGATGGLNFVFDKIGIAPGQSLEAKTQACIIAAKSNLRADYCDTFSKIKLAGQTQYISCDNEQITKNLREEVTPLDCKDEGDVVEKNYCIQLIQAKNADEDTKVNSVFCAQKVRCADLGNEAHTLQKKGNDIKCESKERTYLKGFFEAEEYICCVKA